jgi:hypothetical protein
MGEQGTTVTAIETLSRNWIKSTWPPSQPAIIFAAFISRIDLLAFICIRALLSLLFPSHMLFDSLDNFPYLHECLRTITFSLRNFPDKGQSGLDLIMSDISF